MTNEERIKALRRCSYTTVAGVDREDGYCKPCAYFAEDASDITCIDRMMIDAADALEAAEKRISELEAQMPKEDERMWIWDADTGIYRCSECGGASPREDQDGEYIDCPNYCPNCGAKMDG